MAKLRTDAVSRTAVRQLAEQGFRVPNYPDSEIPFLPPDITGLGDESLMDLFVCLTAWTDFVGMQVACAQIDERSASRALDAAEASLYSRSTSSSERVTDLKAKVAAHPDVLKARETLDEKHAYRKVIEALFSSIERDASLVSREITRRTSTSSRRDRWSA